MIYRLLTVLGMIYELGESTGAGDETVDHISSNSTQGPGCFRVFLNTGHYIDIYNPVEVWQDPNPQPSENLPKPT